MEDPFPNQVLLSLKEVLTLLGMSRNTFKEFLADNTTGFPKPIPMGKERNGKVRQRWRKSDVLAYIHLRASN